MTPPRRGSLIVFEGLDRAGKSTQCSKLSAKLKQQGRDVLDLRFPDRSTPIGHMIDEYLKGNCQQEDHAIHLLFSANRWEAVPKIEEALAAGKEVVIDRYYYSGCVYSAAKNNPSLSLQWARRPDEGLPKPDICVFLTISLEEAAKRGGFGRERYENIEMQDRVRQLFDVLRSSAEQSDFAVVDGGQGSDEVERAVQIVVEKVLNDTAGKSKPLTRVEPW